MLCVNVNNSPFDLDFSVDMAKLNDNSEQSEELSIEFQRKMVTMASSSGGDDDGNDKSELESESKIGTEMCPLQQISLDIEVKLSKPSSQSNLEKLIPLICGFIHGQENILNWQSFKPDGDEEIAKTVDRLLVSCSTINEGIPFQCTIEQLESARFHAYTLKKFGAMAEEISLERSEDGAAVGSFQWEIPCMELDNLWENLVFDGQIKNELLNFIHSLLDLSHNGADPAILPVNRLLLIHGPPGTGKTTLCKALAQKLAIRTQSSYKRALLIEVNSHSLFSKWFSESGKLIQKLFTRIEELAEQPNWLVFVLIDEVESLTMGRNAVFSGSDPSDSVRAVNAILTQLDKIKRYPNVFMLCTSNLEKTLDPAFVDRADLVRHIGNPSEAAIAFILESGIAELQRIKRVGVAEDGSRLGVNGEQKLKRISSECSGAALSGRSLRKLPVLAYSSARPTATSADAPVPVEVLLNALSTLVSHKSSTFAL